MQWSLCVILVLVLVLNCGDGYGRFPSLSQSVRLGQRQRETRRYKRSPTIADRPSCDDGVQNDESPIVVNTTIQLGKFREELKKVPVQAYIIPMADNHQSEYVSEYDKRLQFISGFSGSAGEAIVTTTKAALWTDGRYFLQAEQELDCNWIIMQQGEPGVPEPDEWLIEQLENGDTVGADPSLLSYDKWTSMATKLSESSKGLILKAEADAVDKVWEDQPPRPNNPLITLGIEFSGEEWKDKVNRLRDWMGDSAKVTIVTALDETAWLFNLRGTDIPYNPVFFAFTIVEMNKVTLYLEEMSRLTNEVQQHLNTGPDGSCSSDDNCVWVKDYGDFLDDITTITTDLPTGEKVWVSPMSSYGVYERLGINDNVRKDRAFLKSSAVRVMKGRKNHQEIEGLKKCHKRDSVAVIEFLTKIEREIKEGKQWTELSASDELLLFRSEMEHFQTESFHPISASGPNGAVIHYTASKETNRAITTSDMYLLDSGGQYLDGTTDVTRTLHFGTPTDFQMEAYTRVLMGAIDLATTIWANGTYGRDIDAIARSPLWAVGLDYRHGTGHGIGAFLNVHEGPGRISIGYRKTSYEWPLYGEMFFSDGPGRINIGYRPLDYEEPLYGNMTFSDEPGFYQDGEFGIRLETIVMTKKLDLPNKFGDKDYLGFEAFTLVPFEPNLIKYELLSKKELQWLNEYNARVLKEIGEEMLAPAGLTAEYEWVKLRTKHINIDDSIISSASFMKFYFNIPLLVLFILVIKFL